MSEDDLLLRQYVRDGDENAFRELVERHLPMVYSVALRLLSGDAHAAEDVSQQVFLALARGADRISGREMLVGWLCRTTRNLAANVVRAESRRRSRERVVASERETVHIPEVADSNDANWQCVSSLLEEAMSGLSVTDHNALLLRFFRRLDFHAVGVELGVSDDTAQKRVSRALERLRQALGQRGVALSVAGLGTLLAGNAVEAAPPSLVTAVLAGVKSAAVPGTVWGWTSHWAVKALGVVTAICILLVILAWRSANNAVFDLATDFPPQSGNASAWSPGWSSTLGGPLTPLDYVKHVRSANGEPLTAWQVDIVGRPTLAKNVGAETAISAGGAFVAPAGAVYLTAEVGDTPRKFGVIRFTTPSGRSGSYRLIAAVQPIFLGASSGDTDFHILKNGVELFGRFLGPEAGASFSDVIQLNARDTVDFVVGQGRNPYDEGSSLRIEATLAATSVNAGRHAVKNLALAPVILSSPSDQGALQGESVEFDALVVGTPPLKYQWWFESTSVAGATNSRLRIDSAETSLVGRYHVVVSNAGGAVTSAPSRLAVVTCVPAPRDLAAWWRGEEDARDRHGGQHGLAMAGVSFISGRSGKGFLFAGPEAGVHVPGSATLDVGAGEGFTLEMWLKPDKTLGKIPLFGWNGTNKDGVNFSAFNGQLYANLHDSEGESHRVNGDGDVVLVPNCWKHVALTFDRPSQVLRLFVNGAIVADQSTDSFHPNTVFDLQIGRRFEAGTVLTYSGVMDEVSLYRRALTPQEIAMIVHAGSAGKCQESVAAAVQSAPDQAHPDTVHPDRLGDAGFQP